MSHLPSAATGNATVSSGLEGIDLRVPSLPPGRELESTQGFLLDDLPSPPKAHPATLAIHADEALELQPDVAPPIHVSTTFRYPRDPTKLIAARDHQSYNPTEFVYSRATAPSTTRLEAILAPLLRSPNPVLTYSSGLSAIHAILTFLTPKAISVGDCYHGSHGVIGLYKRLTNCKVLDLDCPADVLNNGDVILLETPVNPTGQALNIKAFAEKAHSRGAYLFVDSTFAPPPLQDPFALGADVVMHSGTKYIGGHSDLLCGILAVKRKEWIPRLREDRVYLGAVMGGLESWLGIRSIRTLELRVERQARNATEIVTWLNHALDSSSSSSSSSPLPKTSTDPSRSTLYAPTSLSKILMTLHSIPGPHSSLQSQPHHPDSTWLNSQMPDPSLQSPVFSILTHTESQARSLPSKLRYFHHATSLGGVESLIEWRCMSDSGCDRRLVRVSVGVEDVRDLMGDLLSAFEALGQLKDEEEVIEQREQQEQQQKEVKVVQAAAFPWTELK